MIPEDKVTEIYFIIDEFCKEFDATLRERSLQNTQTRKRNRSFTMSQSEVMTLLLLFHLGAFTQLSLTFPRNPVQNESGRSPWR